MVKVAEVDASAISNERKVDVNSTLIAESKMQCENW